MYFSICYPRRWIESLEVLGMYYQSLAINPQISTFWCAVPSHTHKVEESTYDSTQERKTVNAYFHPWLNRAEDYSRREQNGDEVSKTDMNGVTDC